MQYHMLNDRYYHQIPILWDLLRLNGIEMYSVAVVDTRALSPPPLPPEILVSIVTA